MLNFKVFGAGGIGGETPVGQQLFESSTSFTVPDGVTSICAVAVGGGGASGNSGSGFSGGGGGGGGLAWGNDISVTPGESLTITVGAGGTNPSGAGGESGIQRATTWLLRASGGNGGSSTNSGGIVTGTGGTYLVGDGGGTGGTGGQTGNNTAGGGGGGAGGYAGNGGVGGYGNSGSQATAGTGGAGGGGNPNGSAGAYGGGGVGVYGQGANGAVNSGGSGGGNPVVAASSGQTTGGLYGGGGGAEEDDTTITGTKGGAGAVRIIWGDDRSFPSNSEINSGASLYMSMENTDPVDLGSYTFTGYNGCGRSTARSYFGTYSLINTTASDAYGALSPDIKLDSTSSWSFETFVFFGTGGTSTDMNIICSQYLSSGSTGRMLFGEQSGQLVLRINGSTVYLTGAVSTQTWYHVALCSDGTNMSLFIDGTRVDTSTTVPTFAQDVGLTLMGQPSSQLANYCLYGYLDDVVIYIGDSRYDPTANSITVPTAPYA